jgi:DNA-binding NtrC family response regulator
MGTAKHSSFRVLVVDDDAEQRTLITQLVAAHGFCAQSASDGAEALQIHQRTPADVIVTDLMMPTMDGFELLRNLEANGDRTPTIVLTGFGSIEKAISIVHDLRAFWFLEKPIQARILCTLLERAVMQKRLLDETKLLSRQLSHRGILGDMVGSTPEMRQVYSLISQVAPTSAAVLITGESGTGKELVARALHNSSPRSVGPFIAVNCAAMPETLMESELFGHEKGAFTGAVERHAGCFEQAHSGSVLLDEIGDMPVATQAKLLRVLEDHTVRRLGGKSDIPVDVRVIAATNRSPEQAIQDKILREDLYYRLNVFRIALPPLRERKDDIPVICEAILSNLNQKHGCHVGSIHADVLDAFQQASWPGNIRQLRNVLERAVIVAGDGAIMRHHLSPGWNGGSVQAISIPQPEQASDENELRIRVGPQMRDIEEQYMKLVLRHTNNNKTRAAKILGISIRTLQNRLSELASAQASHSAASGD